MAEIARFFEDTFSKQLYREATATAERRPEGSACTIGRFCGVKRPTHVPTRGRVKHEQARASSTLFPTLPLCRITLSSIRKLRPHPHLRERRMIASPPARDGARHTWLPDRSLSRPAHDATPQALAKEGKRYAACVLARWDPARRARTLINCLDSSA